MAGEIEQPELDWVANAPRSIFFDDIYFSGEGPAETAHVFVDGNDLPARFRTCDRIVIGELGFGTGLNFLVAADLFLRTRRPGARLEFFSVEKFPLSAPDLKRAQSAWPQFARLSQRLTDRLPTAAAGFHRIDFGDGVALTLLYGDAQTMLSRIDAAADAWFLDGFAPAKNPDMWSPALFSEIARLSASGASAATFTVAGAVRRALASAGFTLEKRTGFGRKREMLVAALGQKPQTSARRAPWFQNAGLTPLRAGARVAIIGGGIAGAAIADALAHAGASPVIFDRAGLAAGASGNPAGIIMPRLDADDTPAARLFIAAYLHALQTIDRLEAASGERFFNPCGVLVRAEDDEMRTRQAKIIVQGALPESHLRAVADGLFLPQAGVIEPARFVAALARGIPIERFNIEAITSGSGVVRVRLAGGDLREFDAAVIANGRDALRFLAAKTLPLEGVAGQIDLFDRATPPPNVVAFGPYAAPAPGGGLVIGATYDRIASGEAAEISRRATEANIAALGPLAAGLDPGASRPRASIRCQSSDRLPVAGPLPDWDFYGAAYDDLRLGKRQDYPPGEIAPGLFILSGLGSRGLTSAPFLAAQMVAEMTGAPYERDLADALHPSRFFIRALKRSTASTR